MSYGCWGGGGSGGDYVSRQNLYSLTQYPAKLIVNNEFILNVKAISLILSILIVFY